jgi:glycosidase
VPPTAREYNVETERKDPDSIFNTYKRLLALRKSEPALRDGSFESVNNSDPNVFTFLRRSGNSTVLVALNFSGEAQTVSLPSSGSTGEPTSLFTTSGTEQVASGKVLLKPFGVYIGKMQ